MKSKTKARRCRSTAILRSAMLRFSARSRLHHGVVISNYFNEILDCIADFFASKMVFNEKQKAKGSMNRSSAGKKIQ